MFLDLWVLWVRRYGLKFDLQRNCDEIALQLNSINLRLEYLLSQLFIQKTGNQNVF